MDDNKIYVNSIISYNFIKICMFAMNKIYLHILKLFLILSIDNIVIKFLIGHEIPDCF
jgi:hypothetical protein